MLEDRRSEILRALVEVHIETGEPVSSRAIVERTDLSVSSATIRNDLVALEQEGYLEQPHTSAGRVPTASAYRYYVDHLSPAPLRHTAQTRIDSVFGDVHLERGVFRLRSPSSERDSRCKEDSMAVRTRRRYS